jgi:hypothetical protein
MTSEREPICLICGKPIQEGSFVVFEHGGFAHVRCRSREVEVSALENAERAKETRARAAETLEKLAERQAQLSRRDVHPCPLCGQDATVTDWRPSSLEWLVVEGCTCGDFFVSAAVFQGRFPHLSDAERQTLVSRIRWFRAKGAEAWCTTTDGGVEGPLDIRERRGP